MSVGVLRDDFGDRRDPSPVGVHRRFDTVLGGVGSGFAADEAHPAPADLPAVVGVNPRNVLRHRELVRAGGEYAFRVPVHVQGTLVRFDIHFPDIHTPDLHSEGEAINRRAEFFFEPFVVGDIDEDRP